MKMLGKGCNVFFKLQWTFTVVTAIHRQELFPYGPQRGDLILQEGDDETSKVIKLKRPLHFFEAQFSDLYVGTNGIISTQDFPIETEYIDDSFPTDFPVIAPFLSDIDTSNGKGVISYREDTSPDVLARAAEEIRRGFPQSTFYPTNTFLSTWEKVAPYEEVTRTTGPSNRFNTFQVVLAFDDSNAYALFLYPEDGLQFFGTRPKEAYNVQLELPARVGFSRGEIAFLIWRKEGPYYSVTSSEQTVKNLYQASNTGVPGVWLFHIGSTSQFDNIIPAEVGGRPSEGNSVVTLDSTLNNPQQPNVQESEYIDENDEYLESFYDSEDPEYGPLEPTEFILNIHAQPDFSTYPKIGATPPHTEVAGVPAYSDTEDLPSYNEPHNPVDGLSPSFPDPDNAPSSPELSNLPLHPDVEVEPSYSETGVQPVPSSPQYNAAPSYPEVGALPTQNERSVLPSASYSENGALPSYPEHETVPFYPEADAVLSKANILPEGKITSHGYPVSENNPSVDHLRRVVNVEEDVDFNTGILTYNTDDRETCQRKQGQCSQYAFCVDYSTGFCCHCQSGYYGNGQHCLPEGAPHRVNGKVSGRLLVGQTAVDFSNVDLHAYVVVNDGRIYTAISDIPEPAGWALLPLSTIGGLFGWLFALEKPGFENGFSITGAKFTQHAEVTFYPGNERLHITQTADGLDTQNYLNVKTDLQGQLPQIPQDATVQLEPYKELYYYSNSVSTSAAHREYTVNSSESGRQKLSYQLQQNITYQDCRYTPRNVPSAQELSINRVFVLYSKEERVLRYAVTNHIGPIQADPDPRVVNPCYDGTHECDTAAQCLPGIRLAYTCECTTGYQGDGRNCFDVDECTEGLNRCGSYSICINFPGSYRCECQSGYELAADRQTCTLIAVPSNPCKDGSHNCDSADRAHCVYNGGYSFSCVCLPGYAGNGHICTDVNECSEGRCHPAATCYNTAGSFVCRCNPRYEGDGFVCTLKYENTRPKTACEEQRDRLQGEFSPRGARPGLGRHIPQCDEDGNYRPLQCHSSTGSCWCVDANGQELPGTLTTPGSVPPSCGITDNIHLKTACEEQRDRLQAQLSSQGVRPGFGQHIPECDEEGNYRPLQCHSGTGSCWCVDANGWELPGTLTPVGSAPPRCGVPEPTHRPQTVCERWKKSLLEYYGGQPKDDQYLPRCDDLGNFTPLQCHGKTDYCWCVDKDGREIEGTRSQHGVSPPCLPSVAPPTVRPAPRPDVTPPGTDTFLLYAQGQHIGHLPLNGTAFDKERAKSLQALHGSIVVAIDYECQDKIVYWTDIAGRTINRVKLEPGAEPETIINSGLISPEGLTIDYLRRNMYWTDSGLDKIEMSKLDGSERRVLFDTDLVNPRAIIVDSLTGNLYWTDWNREAPKIETSSADGSNRRILVNDGIGLPNGLTFDPFSRQICWADAGTKKLECINPDRTGRHVVRSNLNYPFSLVSYSNSFYYTDWRRSGIIALNKDNSQLTEEYLPEQRSQLYGITIAYPYCPSGRK
ncbi:nidogen-2 [Latimeria chalumnae]|uniref:nidogen-2 n=1 Tax=Latimeria chalumnae TaxID=7897 RepID=UPI0003C12F0F|nr:PREDICTED: nidogen-2 [Latimeria chalumnae]|eukprot:XP_005996047.1 PREDICTED: nidogen-2 [Latimeria chalumnae]